MQKGMHILNALNIANAPAGAYELNDILLATHAFSQRATNMSASDDGITFKDVTAALESLTSKIDYTDEFKSSMRKAFNRATDALAMNTLFASSIQQWPALSRGQRLLACREFGSVVSSALQQEMRMPIAMNEPFHKKIRSQYSGEKPYLNMEETLSVIPVFIPGRNHNLLSIDVSSNAEGDTAAHMLKNLSSANLYFAMEEMSQNGVHVPKQFQPDIDLWRSVKQQNAYVPNQWPNVFENQFFRRQWNDVSARLADDITVAVAEQDLPKLPQVGFFRRMLGG